MSDTIEDLMRGLYPYAESHGVIRGFPAGGRPTDAILEELRGIASKEDEAWETGRCSGTMYSGDHEHYDFLNSICALFSYVNSLQRDICPSMTRFESDIIAMTLDLMHGDEVSKQQPGHKACGAVGFGGTESIINPLLVYRDKAREERGIDRPKVIVPDTAHPAFRKGAHFLGIEVVVAPTDPNTTLVDVDFVRDRIDERTVAIVGSAGNYPYGTIDPIGALSDLAVKHGIGLHVDGCTARSDLDIRRHTQVRIRAQRHLRGGLPRRVVSQVPVPHRAELEGRHLCFQWACGQPVGRPHRGNLGRHGALRQGRLLALRQADL
jgi:glutamate/tyrosine decarboxylase-like PLP-dependent enzyme